MKKKSKNAPENRGQSALKECTVCHTVKKTIRIVKDGKGKFLLQCECGLTDRDGRPVCL